MLLRHPLECFSGTGGHGLFADGQNDGGRQLRQLQRCRNIKDDKGFCMESWRLPAF
jgi:hypothetical protein